MLDVFWAQCIMKFNIKYLLIIFNHCDVRSVKYKAIFLMSQSNYLWKLNVQVQSDMASIYILLETRGHKIKFDCVVFNKTIGKVGRIVYDNT